MTRSPPNPLKSDLCARPDEADGPPSVHLCDFDDQTFRTIDLTNDTVTGRVGVTGPQSYDSTGGQTQWGFGMMLVPYLLDWGDRVHQLDRSLAHVTILKAFPDWRDRRLALVHLDRFTWKQDDCTTPLQRYVIGHVEHVGYNWIPQALKIWFAAATAGSSCGTGFTQSSRSEAVAQAQAWLLRTRPLWLELTSEPFPFDIANTAGYWDPSYDLAPLPRESAAQTQR